MLEGYLSFNIVLNSGIPYREVLTASDLRAAISEFVPEVRDVLLAHPARASQQHRDARHEPLDENETVERIREEDAHFLVKRWAWTNPTFSGGSGSFWSQAYFVDDITCHISGSFSEKVDLRLGCHFPKAASEDLNAWIGQQRRLYPHLTLRLTQDEAQHVYINEAVDISKGIKIKELKQRMKTFAETARAVRDS